MTHSLLLFLTPALIGQTGMSGGGLAAVLAVAAMLAATVVVLVLRLRATRRALKSLSVEHQSTTEAHRALLDKERKLGKDLDQRRDEIKELKQDLGSQKKKGHSSQEEVKSLRAEIKLVLAFVGTY